jgi:hypothetical protein
MAQAALPKTEAYARAIIAAARTYGDDPVAVLASPKRGDKRCLFAVVDALSRVSGLPMRRIAKPLRVQDSSVRTARSQHRGAYTSARLAAEAAVADLVSIVQHDARVQSVRRSEPVRIVPQSSMGVSAPPPAMTRSRPMKVVADSTEARILKELAEGPRNTCALATILDVKEGVVSSTLKIMAYEGLVVAGPLPDGGLRVQPWYISARAGQ